jgi:dolichol-phosphate mannosyltransferase
LTKFYPKVEKRGLQQEIMVYDFTHEGREMDKVISLPVFNEEKTIKGLISEIKELSFFKKIIIVNDCSTDSTMQILREVMDDELIVINNSQNLGHGPSTLLGLFKALELGYDAVVTADGDGHYQVSDLKAMTEQLLTSKADVVEGVRTHRSDPWFRKLSSLTTRNLVRIRCRKSVQDANTPIRAYKVDVARRILSTIPSKTYPIPNLYISAQSRKLNLNIGIFPIATLERENSQKLGTTWRQRYRNLPTKRYLKFCLNATFHWFLKK